MSTLITQLVDKRNNIWNETRALLDQAAAEKRDLTAEEEGTYQALSSDLTALRSRIDQLEATEVTARETEEALTRMLGKGRAEPQPGCTMDAQLRSLAKGEIAAVQISAQESGEAIRALTKGVPTAGGNLVPSTFASALYEHLVDASSVLDLRPTILTTQSGEPIPLPVTTSYGAAERVAEAASIAAQSTDPAFAQRTLGAFKFAQIVRASSELVQDSAFDIEGFIARIAGRNVGMALDKDLVVGTGTGQPSGILTGATLGVTGAAGQVGMFTADNLIDLMFSVIGPYRDSQSAAWLVKDATLAAIRKLKDGGDRYLFDPAAVVGQPDTLLGKPIKSDPNMPGTAALAESVLFGDFSAYFVRLAGGVRIERSTDFAFDTDEIAFRVIQRADGQLADLTGAVKFFAGGAA